LSNGTCLNIYTAIRARLGDILALRANRRKKADGSYVTAADLLCDRIIREHLDSSFTVISEEGEAPPGALELSGAYAIVDPLDGTENFTSGLKEWGISISLWRDGRHVESFIGLPELDLALSSGAAIERWAGSRIYGLSSSLSKQDLCRLPEGFEYRITGCAVFNLFSVITGSFAVFENFKGANAWDILAGISLAREHGLDVTVNGATYEGNLIQPDRRYRIKIHA
jgi:myo-inositol-1(or 4)-monophosphatase